MGITVQSARDMAPCRQMILIRGTFASVRYIYLTVTKNNYSVNIWFITVSLCEASSAYKMNRRWQKDGQGRYESLQSYGTFIDKLPPLDRNLGIADTADLYATYSTLHAKKRNPRIAANTELGFYYFIADAADDAHASAAHQTQIVGQSLPQQEQGGIGQEWPQDMALDAQATCQQQVSLYMVHASMHGSVCMQTMSSVSMHTA